MNFFKYFKLYLLISIVTIDGLLRVSYDAYFRFTNRISTVHFKKEFEHVFIGFCNLNQIEQVDLQESENLFSLSNFKNFL